jgi:hypothetical protein
MDPFPSHERLRATAWRVGERRDLRAPAGRAVLAPSPLLLLATTSSWREVG